MLPKSTVRGWQIEQLRKGVRTFNSFLQIIDPNDATIYRDDGTGWTVLEVVCHLRDFEAVFLERARVTVEQDSPPLPFPDPDAMAVDGLYNEQDLGVAYTEWVKRREAFLDYLEKLDESDWDRVAVHPKRGLMSLSDQLALCAWHDVNHFEQITRILAEKKTG